MKQRTNDARDRILASAKHLFATKGYDGTSVKEICHDAGVNVSLIYYYFDDKENILQELLEVYLKGFKTLAEDQELVAEPVKGIRRIAGQIIRFRMEDREMMTILHREILTQGLRHESMKEYIYPLWDKLCKLLEQGRDKGIFQFNSCEQAFQMVISVMLFPRINPHFLAPMLKEESPTYEIWLDYTMHFILGGLYYQCEM